ncbi:MAG: TPM domain-containing protein [Rhodanobacteraceae bacterium]
MRWFRHLLHAYGARRRFPPALLDTIQQAIVASEQDHLGEICVVIESALRLTDIVRGLSARERANDVFAHSRIWDTANNNGVLIYVLLADRAIEIVADRGIATRVDAGEWADICARMQTYFARGEYERGTVAGIDAVGALLTRHFPVHGHDNPDELPDRPLISGR